MKTLQNNFTTPEQSKRLLELGVPADSADCFFASFEQEELGQPHMLYGLLYSKRVPSGYEKKYLPCWSVGRLIEIITICCNHYSGNNDIIFNQAAVNYGMIECLIAYLAIEKKDVNVDFSKLEE